MLTTANLKNYISSLAKKQNYKVGDDSGKHIRFVVPVLDNVFIQPKCQGSFVLSVPVGDFELLFYHEISLQDQECGELNLITAKSSIYSTKPHYILTYNRKCPTTL